MEALARSGVGHFVLVDDDKVCLTNINRQIIATRSSVGKYKVDVMKERILDINPKAEVETYKCFYLPENADDFDFTKYSYVVDAVDTVTAKIEIIMRAKACNVPVISCMGAGNKLDPTKFRVADIYKTNMCPLAKVMRREMKKRGVSRLKVVYSEEPATRPIPEIAKLCSEEKELAAAADKACVENEDLAVSNAAENKAAAKSFSANDTVGAKTSDKASGSDSDFTPRKRDVPGSTAFVPSMAGLLIGGEVIKDLTRAEFAAARS